ncbi:MAG: TIGR04255 family protein [Candidatus Nanopelagicales bacterium]|nr:TIGR04255 family protein [Candidatus Nanopelagicales bacterium]
MQRGPDVTFSRPPLIEKSLGVEFGDPLSAQTILYMSALWRNRYPTVQAQAPLLPQLPLGATGSLIGLQLGVPFPRFWLISVDDTKLIQIQPDRLLVNWRLRDESTYPRYGELRSELLELLREACDLLDEARIVSVDASYFNLIRGVRPGSGLADVLVSAAELPSDSNGTLVNVQILEVPPDGAPRSEFKLEAGQMKGSPSDIALNVFARSELRGSAASSDVVRSGLDHVHEMCLDGFLRHTEESIQQSWERVS